MIPKMSTMCAADSLESAEVIRTGKRTREKQENTAIIIEQAITLDVINDASTPKRTAKA